MLNGRIYRVAFAPFVIALAVASFSLIPRPRPLTTTLAPDAFNGADAFAELKQLAAEFPERRPGSPGDQRLAEHVAHTIEGLGGAAAGGFTVKVRSLQAQTIAGEQTLETVVAERPGASTANPIVVLADRDAAQSGSQAQLSGTAVLLELAKVFAARQTQRTIVLVSSSGGSGGDAGAIDWAAHAHGPFDAAIVLGDVASQRTREPIVAPYSDGYGSAPDALQRTVAAAIMREANIQPGAPSVLGQLAHLAFPFAPGAQGALLAAGLPAVLVQVSGERGPSARTRVSAERLEGVGKSVLSAVDAIDTAPDLEAAPQTGLVLARQIVPGWALRLLIGTLLAPPLLVLVDGLARARRRHGPVGRWVLWALACALPFLVVALFALVLGAAGVLSAASREPVLPGALPFDGGAAQAVLACALVLGFAWLAWPLLARRGGLTVRPLSGEVGADAAGVAILLVLALLAVVVWAANPYAALLLVPALHLLLPIASPERRPRPLAGLALLALALVPLGLLVAFYVDQLGYGPGQLAWTAVLLLAGGHVGVLGAVLWSVGLGGGAALALLACTPPADPVGPGAEEHPEVTIRGPLSYAGPGSLGGTRSALRR